MKPQNRQSISRKYQMADDELLNLIKLLTLTRNSCAHGNRIYCLKTNDIPLPNQSVYPLQYAFINSTIGDHKLFNVLIAIKYFVPKKRYAALINSVNTLLTVLAHSLKSILITDVLNVMGFPPNWRDLSN